MNFNITNYLKKREESILLRELCRQEKNIQSTAHILLSNPEQSKISKEVFTKECNDLSIVITDRNGEYKDLSTHSYGILGNKKLICLKECEEFGNILQNMYREFINKYGEYYRSIAGITFGEVLIFSTLTTIYNLVYFIQTAQINTFFRYIRTIRSTMVKKGN